MDFDKLCETHIAEIPEVYNDEQVNEALGTLLLVAALPGLALMFLHLWAVVHIIKKVIKSSRSGDSTQEIDNKVDNIINQLKSLKSDFKKARKDPAKQKMIAKDIQATVKEMDDIVRGAKGEHPKIVKQWTAAVMKMEKATTKERVKALDTEEVLDDVEAVKAR